VPPDFLAFRWNNTVRQLNRVIDYEIVGHLDEGFASATREESGGPHAAVGPLLNSVNRRRGARWRVNEPGALP
jgi:hypothetical protein